MAKFKFILFGLAPEWLRLIHIESRRQNVSVADYVRAAVKHYYRSTRPKVVAEPHSYRVDLSKPIVEWTKDEEKYADWVMWDFREHDR